MLNCFKERLQSPALPALLLLFGMVFGFAFFHFAGFKWSSTATHLYYLCLLVWGGAICLYRKLGGERLAIADRIFLAFLLTVVASLVVHWEVNGASAKYGQMLPFFVLLPYVLGRLMRATDFVLFIQMLPWIGFFIIILCITDLWLMRSTELVRERWTFFGHNHSPLLIAQVLSAGLLVQTYRLFSPKRISEAARDNYAIILGGQGVMAAGLVMIAARGAIVAVTLATTLLITMLPGSFWRKLSISIYLIVVATIAFSLLPAPQTEFYGRLKTLASAGTALNHATVAVEQVIATSENSKDYIPTVTLGSDPRCQSLVAGFNSVAIRRVLYQEAIDLFFQHPFLGVGASNFGKYSCAGEGTYPHSTVLQAFAELGVLGGGLFLALIAVSVLYVFRIRGSSPAESGKAMFLLALFLFFMVSDQIYGSYFMASAAFFMFGVAAAFGTRSPHTCKQVGYAKNSS